MIDAHRDTKWDVATGMSFQLNDDVFPIYRCRPHPGDSKIPFCPWVWNALFPCTLGSIGGSHAIVYLAPNLYFRGPSKLMEKSPPRIQAFIDLHVRPGA